MDKPSERALLPCPFCGGPGKNTVIRDGRQVFCRKCQAAGPPRYHGPEGWAPAWKRAADDWNGRHLLDRGEGE